MIKNWGTAPDGSAVQRVTLQCEGLSATLLSFGAVLQDIRLDGHAHSLVLGFDQLSLYFARSNYFGATVGRYANRIANGRFTLDGETYQLDRNQDDKHTLHGGVDGTGFRNWKLINHAANFVEFEDTLPDGHMGFPAALTVRARYTIESGQTLCFEVSAHSEAPTICNFTCHNYFNLDGTATLKNHFLQLDADSYLPVDAEGIPISGPTSVEGTVFDYRKLRALAGPNGIAPLDHNFCVPNRQKNLKQIARLQSSMSNIALELSTTKPGLQVYSGAGIQSPSAAPYAGIALEPQNWPDAPNNPTFPTAVLRPGQVYFHKTQFQFSRQSAG